MKSEILAQSNQHLIHENNLQELDHYNYGIMCNKISKKIYPLATILCSYIMYCTLFIKCHIVILKLR